MSPDAKILRQAYINWYFRGYGQSSIDDKVEPYLQLPPAEFGWLEAARHALYLPLGNKKYSPQNFFQLENREKSGCISLKTLRKAADSIECDLVYAIRPKQKIRFSKMIWNEVLPEALKHPVIRNRKPEKLAGTIAHIAKEKLYDAEFRRQKGWTERLGSLDGETTPYRIRPPTGFKNSFSRDP